MNTSHDFQLSEKILRSPRHRLPSSCSTRLLRWHAKSRSRTGFVRAVIASATLLVASCEGTTNNTDRHSSTPTSAQTAEDQTTAPATTSAEGQSENFRNKLKAAEEGDYFAQEAVADCYMLGSCGVVKNEALAFNYLLRAAQHDKAIYAQKTVALAYQLGSYGVPQDWKEAAKYYQLAADGGDVTNAPGMLGTLYEGGLGVPQDFARAAKWYRVGAEHGDASAQGNLGQLIAAGRGMKRDVVEAHKWLNLGCANGDGDACVARDRVATLMTTDQITTAQQMAAEWKPINAFEKKK